jgi:hypothetical protein
MGDPRPARLLAVVGRPGPVGGLHRGRLPQPTTFSSDAIGSTVTRHGAALLEAGLTVAQVVRDDGDIYQEAERLGQTGHELRDLLNGAGLRFTQSSADRSPSTEGRYLRDSADLQLGTATVWSP